MKKSTIKNDLEVTNQIGALLDTLETSSAVRTLDYLLGSYRHKLSVERGAVLTNSLVEKEIKTPHKIQLDMLKLNETVDIRKLSYGKLGLAIGITHPQQVKHHLMELIKKNLI